MALNALKTLLPLWLPALSLVLFCLMGLDKSWARRGLRRVPERQLILLALLGGAPGGWLGMLSFRHKTRHLKFRLLFPALTVIQLCICLLPQL